MQVKGNQAELQKWLKFNSTQSDAVDRFITYDDNTQSRKLFAWGILNVFLLILIYRAPELCLD